MAFDFNSTPNQFGDQFLPQTSLTAPATSSASTAPSFNDTMGNYFDKFKNFLSGSKVGNDGQVTPTMFNLTPNQFSATFGQMGQALAKPGSWQARLGGVAAGIGKAKILGDAAKEQDKAMKDWLTKIFTDSGHNGSAAAAIADPNFDTKVLTDNPDASYSLLRFLDSTPNGGK